MLKRMIITIVTIIFHLVIIGSISAKDSKYFSPEGKQISKEEYNKLTINYQTNIKNIKKMKIENLLAETDELGRPKYTYKGGKLWTINYVNMAPKLNTAFQPIAGRLGYDRNGNQTNDPIYFDSKGRPIFNSNGTRFIYSEEEENRKHQLRKKKPWFGREGQGIIGFSDVYGNTTWQGRR